GEWYRGRWGKSGLRWRSFCGLRRLRRRSPCASSTYSWRRGGIGAVFVPWCTDFTRRRRTCGAGCATKYARPRLPTAWRRTSSGNEKECCGPDGSNNDNRWCGGDLSRARAATVTAPVSAGQSADRPDHDGLRRGADGGSAAAPRRIVATDGGGTECAP